MSGSVTISTSGVPVRFRSMKLRVPFSSWMSLPASSSRWARVMPTFLPLSISTQPLAREGQVVLGDLVVLREVRVEVVLPVELGVGRDRAVEGEGGAEAELERRAVEDGQGAGVAEADGADLRIGRRAELDRARAEQLGPRLQLDVGLDADDEFVVRHGPPRGRFPT
jgi:hypothetical protein